MAKIPKFQIIRPEFEEQYPHPMYRRFIVIYAALKCGIVTINILLNDKIVDKCRFIIIPKFIANRGETSCI
jgi:hypothetical protein